MTLEQQYDYLIDCEIVSQKTIDILTAINGYNENTLNDILYFTTGYRNIEQYLEYEDIETYKQYYKGSDE